MDSARFLSIDCGTQSLRVFVFDARGTMLARAQQTFDPPWHSPLQGYAEQNASVYWKALADCCQHLWREGIDPKHLTAAALTTQRGTVVAVDKHGEPLRPAIVWLDERQAESLPPLPLHWRKLHQLSGHQATIQKLRKRAQANWLSVHEPTIWKNTHRMLLLSGYLSYRLTGVYRDAIASQVGYVPFDYKKHQWHSRWDWRWQALGVNRERLPELIPAGKRLGTISAEAAAQTGLPEGLPLIAAGADKACEVLGAGCLSDYQGALSFGTTATFNVVTSRYVSLNPPMPPYPAIEPGRYCLETQIPQGFALVSFFRDHIAAPEIQAELKRTDPDRPMDWLGVLDRWLQESPAGAKGLMWQPALSVQMSGESRSQGALLGMTTQHDKADWYRALVEGLLYALRSGMEQVTQRTGTPITRLYAAGGGAQSVEVMQTAADVFGMTIHRPQTHETSGLGAAICAAVGMGVFPDFPTAVAAMCRATQTFQPRADRSAWYERCYQQVYLPWTQQLAGLYARYPQA